MTGKDENHSLGERWGIIAVNYLMMIAVELKVDWVEPKKQALPAFLVAITVLVYSLSLAVHSASPASNLHRIRARNVSIFPL